MSSTNYAISIIVLLILGLIIKEAAIQDSIKIILCIIVGLVAYSALNTSYSTEKFAVAPKRLTRDDINMMIDLKISAFSSATTSSDRGMTFDQVNTLIRDKMGTISASPSASSSSLTSTQLDNLTKLSALSQLKDPELNTLVQLAKYPPVGLTQAQTTTLTTLGALSGLTPAQTASLTALSGWTPAQTASLTALSGWTPAQTASLTALSGLTTAQTASLTALSGWTPTEITTLTGLVKPSTTVKLPDNMKPGTVVIWSGLATEIPDGWAACDGRIYTGSDGKKIYVPDLRGRFVLGENTQQIIKDSKVTRSEYKMEYDNSKEDKNEYGRESVILDISNIPAHKHWVGKIRGVQGWTNHPDHPEWSSCDYSGSNDKGCSDGASHSGSTGGVGSTNGLGGGATAAFSIMPPYYVLAYIIKL